MEHFRSISTNLRDNSTKIKEVLTYSYQRPASPNKG